MSRMCWGCGHDDVPDDEDECPNCGDKVPCGKCPFCGADMYPSYHHICHLCGADVRGDYAKHMANVRAELAAIEARKQDIPTTEAKPAEQLSMQETTPPPPKPTLPLEQMATYVMHGFPKERILFGSFFLTIFLAVYTVGKVFLFSHVFTGMYGGGFAILAIVAAILGWAFLKIQKNLLTEYVIDKKLSLWYGVITALLWYGSYAAVTATNAFEQARQEAYEQGISYAEQQDWDAADAKLAPYFKDSAFWIILKYIYSGQAWRDGQYDKGTLSAEDIPNLPASLQDNARQLMKQFDAYYAYKNMQEYIQRKPTLRLSKQMMPSQFKKLYLDTYKDADLPTEFQADSAMIRQFVEQEYAIEQQDPMQYRKKLQEPKKWNTFGSVENPQSTTQQRQNAKDEEDYSRGYDDGRFSAAEGIWEDYDEDESEAYINGYQDGQGEAREEMEDERQRQAAEQAKADAKAKKEAEKQRRLDQQRRYGHTTLY